MIGIIFFPLMKAINVLMQKITEINLFENNNIKI